MNTPPTDNPPHRATVRAWGVALLVMGAHAAAACALLCFWPGMGLDPLTAGLLAALLAAAGLVVGVLFGRPVWATVLCALGSLSGWFFGACGLGMLDLSAGVFRVGMFYSLGGGAVFGALLGLWALDYPVPRADAVALACLSGFPVVASQFFGCLIGTAAAVLGPLVLCAAAAGKILADRARLRQQTRPVLWPPDAEPPSLPAWYARPGWASGFGPTQYGLTAAFGAFQVSVLGLLLARPWAGAAGNPPSTAKLPWLLLAGAAAIWSVLWLFAYPFGSRARRGALPGPPHNPAARPAEARDDAGWSLVTLAVLFAMSVEIVVFVQKTHRPFPHAPALLGLLLIVTAIMTAVVLIAAWIFPLIGRVRFSLFSLLYALALLAALAAALFALWTQALGTD